MSIENYPEFASQCKNIIKNNSPEKSLEKIANMKIGDNIKVGKKNAIEIYKCLSDYSIEWDNSKYSNNITSFKKKVNKNINKAEKYLDKNIK